MIRLRTPLLAVLLVVFLSFGAWYAPQALNPVPPSQEKKDNDIAWVSSSPYWLDRQACRWMGLCGIHHLRPDPPFLNLEGPGPLSDSDDALEGSDRRLELRSLPVLDDLDREEAWELLPPPGSQQRLGSGEPAESKPEPSEPPKNSKPETLNKIPKYVLDYAPLVHLCSEEYFWPADIAEHVQHVTPHVEHPVEDEPARLNLTEQLSLHNIHELLNDHASSVYLVSDNDVENRPEWLYSNIGVPVPSDDEDYDDGDGSNPKHSPDQPWQDDAREDAQRLTPPTSWFDADKDRPLNRISDPRRLDNQPDQNANRGPKRRHASPLHARHNKPDESGYSKAPAVLILVDKGSGVVDAFWFFFYSYNLGQTVLGIRFGNHVGDWEHAMVRFEHGVPRGIFFSEHEGGQAYAWDAVEKRGGRPVIYSAVGSHAMYAMPGVQAYILPFKLLKDVTDRGPIWDPAKNIYAYHYDHVAGESEDRGEREGALEPTEENPRAPTGWFHYEGSWGDKVYSLADPRQWRLFGQYHYVTGPAGPKVKQLGRRKMCQSDRCTILRSLVPGTTWY